MIAPRTWGIEWVLPLAELVFWNRVQAVYARRIGESFAKPANDNGPVMFLEAAE